MTSCQGVNDSPKTLRIHSPVRSTRNRGRAAVMITPPRINPTPIRPT